MSIFDLGAELFSNSININGNYEAFLKKYYYIRLNNFKTWKFAPNNSLSQSKLDFVDHLIDLIAKKGDKKNVLLEFVKIDASNKIHYSHSPSFAISFFSMAKLWKEILRINGEEKIFNLLLNGIILFKVKEGVYIQVIGPSILDSVNKNLILKSKNNGNQTGKSKYKSHFSWLDSLCEKIKCKHQKSQCTCIYNKSLSFFNSCSAFNYLNPTQNIFLNSLDSQFESVSQSFMLMLGVNGANSNYVRNSLQKFFFINPELFNACRMLLENCSKMNLEKLKAIVFCKKFIKKNPYKYLKCKKSLRTKKAPHFTRKVKSHKKKLLILNARSKTLGEVFYFFKLIVKFTMPEYLIGSKYNRNILLKKILQVLRLGKLERVQVKHLIKNFKLSDIKWLKNFHQFHKHRLFARFLIGYFEYILHAIFHKSFHATTKSHEGNKLHIYTKEDWNKFRNFGFTTYMIKQQNFEKISKESPNPICGRLKFVPSGSGGVRPICDMKLVNRSLRQVTAILNNLLVCNPELSGFGLCNIPIEKALCEFVKEPGYQYMAKMDLSKCYDTIERNLLVEILENYKRNYFSSENLPSVILRSYISICLKSRKCRMSFDCHKSSTNFKSFINSLIKSKNSSESDTIFIECSVKDSSTFSHSIQQLIIQMTNAYFTNKLSVYKMLNGIPQGMAPSTPLCNIYLGYLENLHVKPFLDKDVKILRMLDDYLIISKSPQSVENALEVLEPIFKFNSEKLDLNFDSTGNVFSNLSWCGVNLLYDQNTPSTELIRATKKNFTLESRYWVTYYMDCRPLNDQSIIAKLFRILLVRCNKYLIETLVNLSTFEELCNQTSQILLKTLFCQMKLSKIQKHAIVPMLIVRNLVLSLSKKFSSYFIRHNKEKVFNSENSNKCALMTRKLFFRNFRNIFKPKYSKKWTQTVLKTKNFGKILL